MKKFLAITLGLILLLTIDNFAQGRVRANLGTNQGGYLTFGGAVGDTIKNVSDTISYKFYVEHTNQISPWLQFKYTKVDATANATLRVNFYQSNDGVTYKPIPHSTADVDYQKVYSTTATTTYNVSFVTDTAVMEGRYIMVSYLTSATPTTGVKGKITGAIKFNAK
jgi:hypothetical protein